MARRIMHINVGYTQRFGPRLKGICPEAFSDANMNAKKTARALSYHSAKRSNFLAERTDSVSKAKA